MTSVLKYVSIYNKIEAAINSGNYPTGTLLPTETELMSIYQVSRTTVRRAVALLQEAGYVRVRQGRGTEILKQKIFSEPYEFQRNRRVVGVTSRTLLEGEVITQGATVEIVPAEIEAAKSLAVEIGSDVYRLQRIKLIHETVFAYVVSYLPCGLFKDLGIYSGHIFSLYQCLQEHYGYYLTRAEENVTAALSKFLESKLLNIPVGSPILICRRTACREREIFEYTVSYFRPDLYQIVLAMEGNYDY